MIFVVGNARSGTTMMGRILGKNKAVHTFPELHFFEQLWSPTEKDQELTEEDAIYFYAKLLKLYHAGYLVKKDFVDYVDQAINEIDFAADNGISLNKITLFEWFLKHESNKHSKQIGCEQTPRNLLYIEEILNLYPNAKIINMIRDPRDVLQSQKNKWKRRFLGASQIPFKESMRAWINYHPITISRIWQMNIKTILKYENHPRVKMVKFEDFINTPESNLVSICKFLDITFDKNMLQVENIGSSGGKDKKEVLGIDKKKSGQWQAGNLNLTEVHFCQRICKDEMQTFDYSQKTVSTNPLAVGLYSVSFPLKFALALLINLNRMKNPVEAIKRRLNK